MASKATNARTNSALLSSGIASHVMATEVLSCLDQHSVARLMAVKKIQRKFLLGMYYCDRHGHQLECQADFRSALRRDMKLQKRKEESMNLLAASMDDLMDGDDEDIKAKKPKKIGCPDCIQEELFEAAPCFLCKNHKNKIEVTTCSCCNLGLCDQCPEEIDNIDYWEELGEWHPGDICAWYLGWGIHHAQCILERQCGSFSA